MTDKCECREICEWSCDKSDQCKARIMVAYRENLELDKDREIIYEEKLDKGE